MSLNKGTLLSLIFALFIRHNLTKTCLGDLLKLVVTMIPDCVPKSLYLFHKRLNIPKFDDNEDFVIHWYCPSCQSHLGEKDSKVQILKCEICKKQTTASESEKKQCYFMYTPIHIQLANMLETTDIWDRISKVKRRVYDNEDKGEITTGNQYRTQQMQDFLNSGDNFTMTFNSDGVRVQKSNNLDIWPIFCSINELDFKTKGKYMVLCGLWFGTKKPSAESLFKPFTAEAKNLYEKGFEWTRKKNWC